ncbi:hypothetical protein [Ructibacterium gallinarum]|uniref:Uncharacterized protein n=1 Tax=Ructibacterium gallinarum TaxID=2779355 RepID=A0A9D5M0E1_9FIRM|nr:hypothetical protein [Ructibacterium gallinarum]MBE5039158.1 hypothetical protein [Ructibacterium gallinarum]
MKKFIGLLTCLTLTLTSVIGFPVSGAETEKLNIGSFEGFDLAAVVNESSTEYTDGTKWGTPDVDRDKLSEAFLVQDGVLWGKDPSTSATVYYDQANTQVLKKKFAKLTAGQTLKVTSRIKLNKSIGSLTEASVRIGGGNGDLKILGFSFNWYNPNAAERYIVSALKQNQQINPWAGSDGDYRGTVVAGYDDVNNIPDNMTDLLTELSIVPVDAAASAYDAVLRLPELGYSTSLRISKEEAEAYDYFAFYTSREKSMADTGKQTMGIASLLITEEDTVPSVPEEGKVSFGEVQLSDASVRFDQDMAAMNLGTVMAAAGSTYENGDTWGANDITDLTDCYTVQDGTLWARGRLNKGQTEANILSRKFAKIQDGESLSVSAVVNFADFAFDETDVSFRLFDSAAAENNYVLLRFNQLWNGQELSALSRNQTPGAWQNENGTGTVLLGRGYWHIASAVPEEDKGLDGDVQMTVTLQPDGDGYKLSLSLAGRQTYTAEKTISKADALGLDTFAVYSSSNGKTSGSANFMGLKNVSIATLPDKTALSPDEDNTLYIPYTNTTGEAKNIVICAAVCGKEDHAQKRFFIEESRYQNFAETKDNLEINVGKIADNEYVRVFLFNDFEQLIPLAESMQVGEV